jgi:hypothetical protein
MKLLLKKETHFADTGTPLRNSDGAILTTEDLSDDGKQVYLHLGNLKFTFKKDAPEIILLNKRLYYIGSIRHLNKADLIDIEAPPEIYVVYDKTEKTVVHFFESLEDAEKCLTKYKAVSDPENVTIIFTYKLQEYK